MHTLTQLKMSTFESEMQFTQKVHKAESFTGKGRHQSYT